MAQSFVLQNAPAQWFEQLGPLSAELERIEGRTMKDMLLDVAREQLLDLHCYGVA